MKILFMVVTLNLILPAYSPQARAQSGLLLQVPEGKKCPDFTRRVENGNCRSYVRNIFTSASASGRCPSGSAPIGEGYCMYNHIYAP